MPFIRRFMAISTLVLGVHCTWKTSLPSDAAAIPIERDHELLIVDDAILGSLSGNAADEPLSFRRAIEHLPTQEGSGDPLFTWMSGWSQRLRDEGQPERADALDKAISCPWLLRNPDNQCSPSCTGCAAKVLRPQDAPFRLVAVANRTDLSVMPDRAGDGGEGR